MRDHRKYVVEPWGKDHAADAAAVRAVLDLLRPEAVTVQADLPFGDAARWPAQVAVAARLLEERSPRHRGDSEQYATTGWLQASDPPVWSAFVTMAPFAYEAVVRGQHGSIADVDDVGTSFVVTLTLAQAVTALLRPRRLVPLTGRGRRGHDRP